MNLNKPKLSSGQKVSVDTGEAIPGLGAHSDVVHTGPVKEPLPKRAVRSVVGFVILGVAMMFLTYVVLATTVFVALSADDRKVGVLRSTFPVGQVPADAIVYASSAPADPSFLGKANEAVFGVPAGSVVQIVTGPDATVFTNKAGIIVANGIPTGYSGDVRHTALSREYVAICLSGDCQEGRAVLVGQDNVIGEVKGYFTLHGLEPFSGAKP